MISSGTFECTADPDGGFVICRLSVLVTRPRAVVVVVVGSPGSGNTDLLGRREWKQLMIKMDWGGFEAGWSEWCPLRLYLTGPSAISGLKFLAFSCAVPEARDPWREWSE